MFINYKTFLGLNFIKYLILICVLALSACGHSNYSMIKSSATDLDRHSKGGGLFVSAAFGPDGRLWRVAPGKNHVYVDYSTDMGKTFSSPVAINAKSQRIKVSGENRPGIIVDRSGQIYVVYAAEGNQPLTAYFSVSIDKGHSFSTPLPLSEKASEANSFQGRLSLSSSGQVYAFWHDERDRMDWRRPGNAIYYRTIGGQSNLDSTAQKLSDTICDCCRIAATSDNVVEPVLLTRFIYPGGIRDHGLIKIRANNEEPISWRVTFDEWAIQACPEHGPSIAISDDGNYHIAWFTLGGIRQGLFYAYSSDQGKHFSEPLSFGTQGKLPSHPDIIAQGEHVILTWIEFDGVKSQLLVMHSNDGGQNWLPAKSIAESTAEVDFPFLLQNDLGTFVSWNSKNEGYRFIQLN